MIGDIENAVLERFKGAGDAGVLSYKYLALEPYPQDWNARLVNLPLNCPAVFFAFAGWPKPERMSDGVFVRPTFGLVVAARHAGNLSTARHGDAVAQPGSLQLLMDAVGLLEGQSLGLPIGGLELGAVQFVDLTADLLAQGLSMIAVEWATSFTIASSDPFYAPTEEFVGDFSTFDVKWMSPIGELLAQDTTIITSEEA